MSLADDESRGPLPRFLAHYSSLDSDSKRERGVFEFESASRIGSKPNMHDARLKMLEIFGNDALSWQIGQIERATSSSPIGGQMELDFREPAKKRRSSMKRGWK